MRQIRNNDFRVANVYIYMEHGYLWTPMYLKTPRTIGASPTVE